MRGKWYDRKGWWVWSYWRMVQPCQNLLHLFHYAGNSLGSVSTKALNYNNLLDASSTLLLLLHECQMAVMNKPSVVRMGALKPLFCTVRFPANIGVLKCCFFEYFSWVSPVSEVHFLITSHKNPHRMAFKSSSSDEPTVLCRLNQIQRFSNILFCSVNAQPPAPDGSFSSLTDRL